MMREIKFRGKRKDNGEWIFGYLMQMHQPERLFIGVWRSIGGDATMKDELFLSFKEIDPETVGQFTGPHDKNGKEIYEGDLWKLSESGYVGIVVWRRSKWDFERAKSSKVYQYPEFNNYANKGEIIGNIHENPEVMK